MTELLEMQGLTPDMVRDYLRGKGWAETTNVRVWMHKESKATLSVYETELQLTVACLAEHEGRHRQEVAAEVNPRLRPGLPSDAARAACRFWVAVHPVMRRVLFGYWEDDALGPILYAGNTIIAEAVGQWSFWPCDANGNKTRWPVDGNGVML